MLLLERDGKKLMVRAQPGEMMPMDGEDTMRQKTFKCSSDEKDRYGDVIHQAPNKRGNGWLLDNFNKGGSWLWAHQSRSLPIGKPVKTWVEYNALFSTVQFPTKDEYPFADTVYQLVKGGFLKGCSVGFDPKVMDGDWSKGYEFFEQELIELSVTPTPVNPQCLVDAKSMGIDIAPLGEWASRSLDEGGSLFLPRSMLEETYQVCKPTATVVTSGVSTKALEDRIEALHVELQTAKAQIAVLSSLAERQQRAASAASSVDTVTEENPWAVLEAAAQIWNAQ